MAYSISRFYTGLELLRTSTSQEKYTFKKENTAGKSKVNVLKCKRLFHHCSTFVLCCVAVW